MDNEKSKRRSKEEISFIPIGNNDSNSNDYRLIRCNMDLNLRREWKKIIFKIKANTIAIRDMPKECNLKDQNWLPVLNDEVQDDRGNK